MHFRCVTGSELASDYNKSNFFTNNKRTKSRFFGTVTLTVTLARILSVQRETLKSPEEDVKCV